MDAFLSVTEFGALLRECGYEDIFEERQTLGIAHIVGGRRGHE
jgi:hypothetical protein